MKRILFLIVSAVLFSSSLSAQFQIPDAGFEAWTPGTGGQFEEPSSNWWTSLNSLRGLGGPVTVEKTTDAHSGTYAAKMQSAQWTTLLLPGLLVCGDFDPFSSTFILTGQPFTERPLSFTGWYKYFPVSGDSAGIAAVLTHWNTATQSRDTIGIAAVVLYDTVSAYTEYVLPFYYNSTDTPDSLILALVSSQGGSDFLGQVGSTLYADDLSFTSATSTPEPSLGFAHVSPNPCSSTLRVSMAITGSVHAELLDLRGKLLHSITSQGEIEMGVADLPSGTYLLRLRQGNKVQHEKVLVAH